MEYTEESIITLDWHEHIRKRPGVYIGKLGDGSLKDDGIYILLKEIIDNSVDEFIMGYGSTIEVEIRDNVVRVRDYGRGIPFGKLIDVASKMNTGAKYDSKVFKKTVGLNGIGIKAVNALSEFLIIKSYRNNLCKEVIFSRGFLQKENEYSLEGNQGTEVIFKPDKQIFGNYSYLPDYVEEMIRNYVYLNKGLKIIYNQKEYFSENGLKDLLLEKLNTQPLYDIVHLVGEDVEIAFTHGNSYTDEYFSFVNGHFTPQGGTHLNAFKEAFVETIRKFFKKDFDSADIRMSLIAAISVKIEEPIFESQTKSKLGSLNVSPNGPSIKSFIGDFVKYELDNYLHKHPEVANIILKKILESEKERKAIIGIQKKAREIFKRAAISNKKLRDSKIHFGDNHSRSIETTIFITEGDSASGSLTIARDPEVQAVFSLRGKPENLFGKSKKFIYQNEELSLLISALGLEEGIDNLRYNYVVIASDADADGLHIRLLITSFFLHFYPELVKNGHLYVLQTPLYRVRNKQQTIYCYSDQEKLDAINKLGKNAEITRFKGLGEISPDEFKGFIRENIRLIPITLSKNDTIQYLLSFYMGSNTPERQNFVLNNIRIEQLFY